MAAMWAGWVAAVGGLLVLLEAGLGLGLGSWATWLGAVLAIVFGAWAALGK